MSLLTLWCTVAYVAYFVIVIRRIGFFTADGIFASIQYLMAVGTIPLLDPERRSDHLYAYIVLYTLITFLIVSGLLHAGTPKNSGASRRVLTIPSTFHVRVMIVVSILITILYFRAVGYSAFVSGLQGNGSDVATLRLDSYSGSRYLFPGYVNQFKNSLLPALTIAVITHWWSTGTRRRLAAASLVGFASFGLLGAGQRGAFVVFLVVAMGYLRALDRQRFPRRAVLALAIAIPLILLSTLALGRAPADTSPSSGALGKTASAVSQFQSRVLGSNQESAIAGFRYIYDRPSQNGKDWASAAVGLLPGFRGSDLDNQIYGTLYGTTRGTAPPSVWGSIYYNFGLEGIALAPIFLALISARLTRRGTAEVDRNAIELVGISGVFAVFGFWAAGDPVFLLNDGIVVYGFLWWWGSRMRKKVSDVYEIAHV